MTGRGFGDACTVIARRHDRERYLACLYAPARARDALFAVLAANHEIAKTAEVVSEPGIGQIRLQWWREAFDGIEAGAPRSHEVVLPLAEAVAGRGLRLERLRRIIDAREADLEGEPPADLEALVRYAASTAGELHAVMAELLHCDTEAAVAVGTGWALIGLMRALPVLVAAGRAPMPEALLQEIGISHQKIKDMGGNVRLGGAVAPVVGRARAHLAAARGSAVYRRADFRPMRLLADRAADHADRLERVGWEPYALPPADTDGLVWRYAGRVMRYRMGF